MLSESGTQPSAHRSAPHPQEERPLKEELLSLHKPEPGSQAGLTVAAMSISDAGQPKWTGRRLPLKTQPLCCARRPPPAQQPRPCPRDTYHQCAQTQRACRGSRVQSSLQVPNFDFPGKDKEIAMSEQANVLNTVQRFLDRGACKRPTRSANGELLLFLQVLFNRHTALGLLERTEYSF